jgi:hypothetical protein
MKNFLISTRDPAIELDTSGLSQNLGLCLDGEFFYKMLL